MTRILRFLPGDPNAVVRAAPSLWVLAAAVAAFAVGCAPARHPRPQDVPPWLQEGPPTEPPRHVPLAPPSPRAARLLDLCRVWAAVRYEDPATLEGAIDWDAALEKVLPAALAASTDEAMTASVRELLASLHDPVSAVEPATTTFRTLDTPPASRRVGDVTVVTVRAWTRANEHVHEGLAQEGASGNVAVVDLRANDPAEGARIADAVEAIASLPRGFLWSGGGGIAQRTVEYRGYPPQIGVDSAQYAEVTATSLPRVYPATAKPHSSRVVFVVNGAVAAPPVVWAMRRSGDAVVVAVGPLAPETFAITSRIPLRTGDVARIRLSTPMDVLPGPDVQLDASASDPDVERVALAAAKAAPSPSPAKTPPERVPEAPRLGWRPDATYSDAPYPAPERRVLALFRFWSVIHYFYPYREMLPDADWDGAFSEALGAFESARDQAEYLDAIEKLAARIPDGHVGVGGPSLPPLEDAPFEVRLMDGKLKVTAITDPAALGRAPIGVGTEIYGFDGEGLPSRVQHAYERVGASNDVARERAALRRALQGPAGSDAKVELMYGGDMIAPYYVHRTTKRPELPRTGPVFRALPGDIGYVDLDRLELADVDRMFDALAGTEAIVFDMRGSPHGTGWAIAARLNVRGARVGAQFFQPFLSADRHVTKRLFEQEIPKTDKPLYRGKTVMLIDERTMSQAEHTGLLFESAAGTKFVGSQTAGTNGDVTNLSLPGGYYVQFTGQEVRHADGRRLQGVGLVPDVEARATFAGIAAGRDEVLERALAYLREGR